MCWPRRQSTAYMINTAAYKILCVCVCICKNEHNELSVLCLSPIGLNILLIKYLLQTFHIQLLTEVQQNICGSLQGGCTLEITITLRTLNPLAPELFFLILAHPVYKM